MYFTVGSYLERARWKPGKNKKILWSDRDDHIGLEKLEALGVELRSIEPLVSLGSVCEKGLTGLDLTISLLLFRQNYALAVDLIRLLVLYDFGGLYLDVGTHSYDIKHEITSFMPTENTVRLLGHAEHHNLATAKNVVLDGKPLETSARDIQVYPAMQGALIAERLENTMMYFGCVKHPVVYGALKIVANSIGSDFYYHSLKKYRISCQKLDVSNNSGDIAAMHWFLNQYPLIASALGYGFYSLSPKVFEYSDRKVLQVVALNTGSSWMLEPSPEHYNLAELKLSKKINKSWQKIKGPRYAEW